MPKPQPQTQNSKSQTSNPNSKPQTLNLNSTPQTSTPNPKLQTLNPKSNPNPKTQTQNPKFQTSTPNLKPQPQTQNLKPQTSTSKPKPPNLKPQFQTPNPEPQPSTPNPKSQTPNPKPSPAIPKRIHRDGVGWEWNKRGAKSAPKFQGKAPKLNLGASLLGNSRREHSIFGIWGSGSSEFPKIQGHLLVQGSVPAQGVHHSSRNLWKMGMDLSRKNSRKTPQIQIKSKLNPKEIRNSRGAQHGIIRAFVPLGLRGF